LTENKELKTEEQRIGELALRTAQWCNASLYQFNRFVSAVEFPNEGKTPWDQGESSSLLHAEKIFLVTALCQMIQYLEALQNKLRERGDDSLTPLLDAVATEDERKQIQQWRNINEHEREYIQGKGVKQNRAKDSSLFLSNFFVGVTDNMIYVNGNTKEFYLGRIRIDLLIPRIKENHSAILERTKEIFNTYYYGIAP
jgi:hypothetical protein